GVVGAYVDVHERPAVLVGDLAAQAVDVVVVSADGDGARAGDRRADGLAPLAIVRGESETVQSRARGMRRHPAGAVAGRGARDGVEVELDRGGDGDRHDPVLV